MNVHRLLPSAALLACISATPAAASDLEPRTVWVDVNGDRTLDLFAYGSAGLRLYVGQPAGGFRDVTLESGLNADMLVSDALWHDVDGDGDSDVVLVGAQGLCLFENSGGAFTDATASSGLVCEGEVLTATWRDVAGDGGLELEVLQPERMLVFQREGGAFAPLVLDLPVVPFAALQPASTPTVDDLRRPAPATGSVSDRERRPLRATESALQSSRASAGAPLSAGGANGAPGGSRSAASAVFGCAQSIADMALPGTCISASSTPVAGSLMPLDRILWAGEASEAMWFDYNAGIDTMALFGGVYGSTSSGPILSARRSDANVGIGTIDPQEDLHVSGGAKAASILIEADTGNSPGGESLHPQLRFLQDGAQMEGLLGFVDGTNDLALRHVTSGHELRLTESGQVGLYEPGGALTIELDVNEDGAGDLALYDTSGISTVVLEGHEGAGGGNLILRAADGTTTVSLDGEEANGSVLRMSDGVGQQTVLLAASEGSTGGNLELFAADGTRTVELDADNTAGAELRLRDASGASTILLHAGSGSITTETLSITGGADIAEPFDVAGGAEPGHVVAIDPEHPGSLRTTTRAYDRTVAGIVSGAGGIQPGLTLVQEGSAARGEHPVALTGRVWCASNTSGGPIRPGDLLTSSNVAGEAMRADDPTRSFGAVLGKAMTSLDEGHGLVLVLVSLQ